MEKFLFLILFMAGAASAEETINLTTPYDPDARTTSGLRWSDIHLHRGSSPPADSSIFVILSSGTITRTCYETGQTAWDSISLINTSNNSSTSLTKRIYNKLISDGCIAGTVNGTPD